MLVRLLLLIILIVISLFCWLSLLNPLDVDFHFFGRTIPTDLSTLMITSFVLGAMLVFLSTLTRDAKRAIQAYRQSRQQKKNELLKGELSKGMEAFFRGDLPKAKTHFGEVLKRDPSQIDLYLRLSEIHLKEGDEEAALHWLERARLIDMSNTDILFREATLYLKMKRSEEAVRALSRITDLDDTNVKAMRMLREIFVEGRRWEEAIQTQKSILKSVKGKEADEENETLFLLGLKYEHAKEALNRGGTEDLEMALKEAKEIVREKRTFMPGFVLLGDIHLRMGRWASAGKVWGKSFTRFKSIIFMLRMEDLYLGREDPSTLLRIYQRLLAHDPEDWVLAFFYAKLCVRLELLDVALETIDEISLKRKDFPALHRLLAEIYAHRQDLGRAVHEFEKTLEWSRTSSLSFYCTACETESEDWVAYCPQCGRWSTYEIKGTGKKVTLLPQSIPERVSFAVGH